MMAENKCSMQDLLDRLPYSFLKKNYLLPIEAGDKIVLARHLKKTPLEALDEVRLILQKPLTIITKEETEIVRGLQKLYSDKGEKRVPQSLKVMRQSSLKIQKIVLRLFGC